MLGEIVFFQPSSSCELAFYPTPYKKYLNLIPPKH
ncbi:MAG: hypothetical protein ACI9IZ_001359, partial [Nonlabens sp.]